MAGRAEAVAAPAVRAPRGGWPGAVVALVAAGAAVLARVGIPSDPTLALIFVGAVAATELLTLDLPDRRGVSMAALPVVMAAAVGGATAAWAAAVGALLASLLRRRTLDQCAFLFGRAALAAAGAAALTDALAPGRLGHRDPIAAAPAAVLCAAGFALLSGAGSWFDRRADGARSPSHIDLLLSVGLAPLAVAAWALGERVGPTGLLAAGGGLLAVLAVVRAAVNVATHHDDLQRLYELTRRVEASSDPAESAEVLASELPRWVPHEQLAILLPVNGDLRVVAARGLPAGWRPPSGLDQLPGNEPASASPDQLPPGTHGVIAAYGRLGVVLLARRRPFRAAERAVLGLLMSQLSSTLEQVRLLDEIERQRAQLAVLLAASGEGIFVLDTAGAVTGVNPALAALLGTSESSLIGRSVGEALPLVDRSAIPIDALLANVEPGAPLRGEGVLTDRAGRPRDVLLSYAAVPGEEGRGGGIGIIRDVTAMKDAQRERDDFVNVMTHDLRQPLAGILGYAQLLERALTRDDADGKLARYAIGVRCGGERMLRMINNLLGLARMESGRVEIEVTRLAIEPLIEEVVQGLENEADTHKLALRTDFPSRLHPIETSEPLLREAIANLVGNAVKYTPDGGSITVTLRQGDGGTTIAVADTGIGIPAEAVPRLFSRFFRTGQSEVRQTRGSGLGLALTKMMVEKIGGSISVESEIGKGSTFTVTLPDSMGPAE